MERRLLLVEVQELGNTDVSKAIHDVPDIILVNCELVETHGLRSGADELL